MDAMAFCRIFHSVYLLHLHDFQINCSIYDWHRPSAGLPGISVDTAFYFSIFLIIPLVFFFYFADISAMVNNFSAFRAIKDSALRVTTGSISVTAFYLFNVAIFFAASFIFSAIWSLLAADVLTPITQMTEAEILAMSQEELLALFTSPEIISSGCMALAWHSRSVLYYSSRFLSPTRPASINADFSIFPLSRPRKTSRELLTRRGAGIT